MSQLACQKFESPCKKIVHYVENDTSLSAYHDFLLSEKGRIIEIMVKVQKEEEEYAKLQKQEECPPCVPCE